ncbi:isoprenyl transferase [Bartonella sp. DGB2]|uniref:isoprenyl transferase n=1 Tax=Bartonella sp. DGB2 TaxID=3388426 RepID=UPI00398FA56E
MHYPRHIAIIMDGNGRWARARGMPRVAGHKAGLDALRRIVSHSAKVGLEWLTLFAFSSENWMRPADEINHLMGLIRLFIKRDLAQLHKNNVCIRMIGDHKGTPQDIVALLCEAVRLTEKNSGLNLVVAFNYGGRDEICRAVKAIVQAVQAGALASESIGKETFSAYLDTRSIPDPDLIIRTSGEQRLSNFLLWQAAYAELYFSPCFWPDFNEEALDRAVIEYFSRERRFGTVKLQNHAL